MTGIRPACDAAQVEGARFCHECGTSLGPPTCTVGGDPLVVGAKAFSACGSSQKLGATAWREALESQLAAVG